MTLAERLAEKLRNLRAETGLSQVQMARRLRISRSTLNRLEAASQNTTLRTLDHLCRTLKYQPGASSSRAACGRLLGERNAHPTRDEGDLLHVLTRGDPATDDCDYIAAAGAVSVTELLE